MEKLFENTLSLIYITEYEELYFDLAGEIGSLQFLFSSLGAALRLNEANQLSIRSLDELYADIDNKFEKINMIFEKMKDKERGLIFAANHVSKDRITHHQEFANYYKDQKEEVTYSLIKADEELLQIKTEYIDHIKNVINRNVEVRKWQLYKTKLNSIESNLDHINSVVHKFAEKVDQKFHTNIIGIIDS